MDQHFRVAPASETHAARFELLAKIKESVNFPVEDDHHRPVDGQHGLVPGRAEVDDGEPPVRESNPEARPQALIVRAASTEPGAHDSELGGRDRTLVVLKSDASDAAH